MTESAAMGITLDPEFNRILTQRGDEVKDLVAMCEQNDPYEAAADKPDRRIWKVVVNKSSLQTQTSITLDGLAEANDPPFVFNRAHLLVRVIFDENDNPFISIITESGVRGILERCVDFVKMDLRGVEKPAYPPIDVVKDLMNLPEWYTIPPLAGIVEAPIVLADGGIVNKKGYDEMTRLFYAPASGLIIPPIPNRPSKADIDKAVDLIKEIFVDFPFVDDSSKANMMAALITAVLRPMISGPVPMAIIDKPQAGTGATLLAEVIAMVATGRSAALMTAPEDDAAWRKAITSTLAQGRNLAIVDNVETKLNAPSLAAVLTANIWTDRILGRSENVTFPHTMFWISTGNNLQLGGDLPRRCFWVRLNAQSARPWQRTNYRHPDLMAWVLQERGCILGAILTIARGWILEGRPKPDASVPKVGGFDGWCNTVGGILGYCKVDGFLKNTEKMYEQADADGPQWEAFFEKWFSIWGVKPVTVADIHFFMQKEGDSSNVAYGSDRLVDLLPDVMADAWCGKKDFSKSFGKALSRMNERKFNSGLTLQKGKNQHKVFNWFLAKQELV